MSLTPGPVALPPHLPSELLTYILAQKTYPTTLIICGTRAAFLSAILKLVSTSHSLPQSPLPSPRHDDPEVTSFPKGVDTPEPPPQPHSLLMPTLHQLSASRHITTVFIPTLSHLRAYLSVFLPSSISSSPAPSPLGRKARDMAAPPDPLLAVYGLVNLHRGTSEWSAQGLGCTAATLVEAGWRTGARVVLIEDRETGGAAVGDGEGNYTSEACGPYGDGGAGDGIARRAHVSKYEMGRQGQEQCQEYWRETLPMLNGSARRSGAEMEYGGRTVEVGAVLRRWFRLGSRDWEDHV